MIPYDAVWQLLPRLCSILDADCYYCSATEASWVCFHYPSDKRHTPSFGYDASTFSHIYRELPLVAISPLVITSCLTLFATHYLSATNQLYVTTAYLKPEVSVAG